MNQLSIDFSGYDRLLEHRSRLIICILLGSEQQLCFSDFKQTLQESDGNLGAQLRKLEEAGYLKVNKQFVARKPVSRYTLTARGNRALGQHLQTIIRLAERL